MVALIGIDLRVFIAFVMDYTVLSEKDIDLATPGYFRNTPMIENTPLMKLMDI